MVKTVVNQFNYAAWVGGFVQLFDLIHPGHMVFSMMIYCVIAVLPVDIDPCIRLEAEMPDAQLWVYLQRILYSDLWGYF